MSQQDFALAGGELACILPRLEDLRVRRLVVKVERVDHVQRHRVALHDLDLGRYTDQGAFQAAYLLLDQIGDADIVLLVFVDVD